MKNEVKEKIYLLIIVFCILMCGAMIVTMIKSPTVQVGEIHMPVMREDEYAENKETIQPAPSLEKDVDTVGENNGDVQSSKEEPELVGDPKQNEENDSRVAITEENINNEIEKYLPESFPVKSVNVDIDAGGEITLSGKVNREQLKNYLKGIGVDIGLKYSVALLMLPKDFEAVVSFDLIESKDGTIKTSIKSAVFNGKEIPVSAFPQKVANVVSDAVNKIITNIVGTFKFCGFEDGALFFEKV